VYRSERPRRTAWIPARGILAGVSLLVAIALGVPGDTRSESQAEPTSTGRTQQAPEDGLRIGWTRLPVPPNVRDGATLIWAGSELLLWGGCSAHDCEPRAGGYTFDAATRRWNRIAKAPRPASYSEALWTGEEAIFVPLEPGAPARGLAYDPAANSWRRIATAPISARYGATLVWTGTEAILWGGGPREGRANRTGAAYSPASDTWRRLPRSPLGLNLASGMWTGREMLVFGSLLNGRNWAATRTSVGSAYDPAADAWRRIPRSSLSAQATSAAWVGERMVAWDHEVHSQTYNPQRNRWTRPIKMPLAFNECYPDSVTVGDRLFAFFCGDAALYDPSAREWRRLHGGPLARVIRSHGYRIKLWRFAELASAADVMFFLAEGVTFTRRGVVCYGCAGSPRSFWAYRPRDPHDAR
jgi:hypothetical protein